MAYSPRAGAFPDVETLCLSVLSSAVVAMLLFYGCLPHLLLVAIAPYVDPTYNTGWFGHAHGVKPGRSVDPTYNTGWFGYYNTGWFWPRSRRQAK